MKVKGYTRKDGTKVKSYNRKKHKTKRDKHGNIIIGRTYDGVNILKQKGKSRFKSKDIRKAIRSVVKNTMA